jgi:hypothetical protein
MDEFWKVAKQAKNEEEQKNIDILNDFFKEERRQRDIQEMKACGVIVIEDERKA